MSPLNRQTTIALAMIPAVLLPTLAGYAVAGVSLAFAFGLAAVVGLAVLDDVLQEDGRGVDVERRAARGEMTTKQLIATGGGTVASAGIVGLIKQDVFGGIVYALTYGVVGLINGFLDNLGRPISAFIGGISDIIGSALTGMLIDAGFRTAARDIQSYGIIAPIVGGVITFAMVAVFVIAFRRIDASPLQLIYDRMP